MSSVARAGGRGWPGSGGASHNSTAPHRLVSRSATQNFSRNPGTDSQGVTPWSRRYSCNVSMVCRERDRSHHTTVAVIIAEHLLDPGGEDLQAVLGQDRL